MSYLGQALARAGMLFAHDAASTSGTTAPDLTGNGYDGTLSDSAIRVASGALFPTPYFLFNGTDRVITIAQTSGLPTGDADFTMVASIDLDASASGLGAIMGWGDRTSNACAILGTQDAATLLTYWYGSDITDTSALLTGRRAWVATRYDQGAGKRSLWLNGVKVAEDSPGAGAFTATNPMIGSSAGNEWFKGAIQYDFFYTSAVSDGDLAADFAAWLAEQPPRLVAVQNTDLDIGGNPQSGTTDINLLVPGGVTPRHTATGKALTKLDAAPDLDGTGFWSQDLIPNGDITPAATTYQFTEPGGRTTNYAFTYADGPTITLADHYPAPDYVGLIRMFLAGIEIDGLIDSTLPLSAQIAQDTTWTGGAGAGQLVSAVNPIDFAPDGFGNAGIYVPRNSELANPATYYVVTNSRSGTPLTFQAPDTYGADDTGNWSSVTTYAAGKIATDPATGVPYISLAGGNTNHAPASSPTWWAPYAGVKITDNLFLPGSTTAPVANETMIASSGPTATHHASPVLLKDDLEEGLYRDTLRYKALGAWSGATAYAVNDVVTLSGVYSACILAHTNHTPPNGTYWLPLTGGAVMLNPASPQSGLLDVTAVFAETEVATKHIGGFWTSAPPTITAGADAGTSPTLFPHDSTHIYADLHGANLSITTGTSPAAGKLLQVTLHDALSDEHRSMSVVVQGTDTASQALVPHAEPHTDGTAWDLVVSGTPAASTTYHFQYVMMGS